MTTPTKSQTGRKRGKQNGPTAKNTPTKRRATGERSTPAAAPQAEVPVIRVGHLLARQCTRYEAAAEAAPLVHRGLFLGISDLAQLTFCEIQSTISQFASQPGYRAAAALDDREGGVGVASGRALDKGQRSRLQQQITRLVESGQIDWETRCLIGKLAETLELSSTASERRHFDCGEFHVIGIPDGLTDSLVVEFAASSYPQLTARTKQVQGNLYATLWGVGRYRVLVIDHETNERHDTEHTADPQAAEEWLLKGWALLNGDTVPSPPTNPRKCTSCRYNRRGGCPYPGTGRIPSLQEMKAVAATRPARRAPM